VSAIAFRRPMSFRTVSPRSIHSAQEVGYRWWNQTTKSEPGSICRRTRDQGTRRAISRRSAACLAALRVSDIGPLVSTGLPFDDGPDVVPAAVFERHRPHGRYDVVVEDDLAELVAVGQIVPVGDRRGAGAPPEQRELVRGVRDQ